MPKSVNDNSSTSNDIKELIGIINNAIATAKKYQKIETKRCSEVFSLVTKSATNATNVYISYFTKTMDSIGTLTKYALGAIATQQEKVWGDSSVKAAGEARHLKQIEDCLNDLDRILSEIKDITAATGKLADIVGPLINMHADLFKKMIKYRKYWENKIKNKYDNIIDLLAKYTKVIKTTPQEIGGQVNEPFQEVKTEIKKLTEKIKEKHTKHVDLLNELNKAQAKGNTYARVEWRRKIHNHKMPDTNIISEADEQKMLKDFSFPNKKIGQLSLLQKQVLAKLKALEQLPSLKELAENRPDSLTKLPIKGSLKGMKKHVLIGKPLFYMLGVLNGIKLFAGLQQKKLLPQLAGYEKEIFKNKHRKWTYVAHKGKVFTKGAIKILAMAGALSGIGAGICGILGELYETAEGILWLVSGCMYAVGDLTSPVLDRDSEEINSAMDDIKADLKNIQAMFDSKNRVDKYFDDWEQNGKVSLETEPSNEKES